MWKIFVETFSWTLKIHKIREIKDQQKYSAMWYVAPQKIQFKTLLGPHIAALHIYSSEVAEIWCVQQ